MTSYDSYFLSHGSPMLALDPGPAGEFWTKLAGTLDRPKAVLSISAHWNTLEPAVCSAAQPETIYDFYGFPQALYQVRYSAPGAPALAQRAAGLLAEAGIACQLDPAYGIDHGTWVPLRSFYPDGIPVAQLAVQPRRDARWHCRLGRALAPLRAEGVLLLASGGAVHNLGEIVREGGDTPAWARAFDDWLAATLAAGDEETLMDWQRAAPNAKRAHPSPEHLLPLFVSYGAAGPGARGELLYHAFTIGSMSMAAYRFRG